MTVKEYRSVLRTFLDENNLEYQTTDNTSYLFRIAQKGIVDTDKTFLYSEYKRLSDIEFDEPEPKIKDDGKTIETIETIETGTIEPDEKSSTIETQGIDTEVTIENITNEGEPSEVTLRQAQRPDNTWIWLLLGFIFVVVITGLILLNKKTSDNE